MTGTLTDHARIAPYISHQVRNVAVKPGIRASVTGRIMTDNSTPYRCRLDVSLQGELHAKLRAKKLIAYESIHLLLICVLKDPGISLNMLSAMP